MIEAWWSDLRFAVRMMRRNRGFTAIAVLTLALGIGANTALFSIVNTVLLKPLPVRNPRQLTLMVWDAAARRLVMRGGYDGSASSGYSTTGHLQGTSFPYLTFERMRQACDTFSNVFAFATNEQVNVVVDGQAELALGQFVTGDYYQGLGVRAWRGRLLAETDEKSGASPAAVITWRYWQRRDQASILNAVRAAMRQVDAQLPIFDVRTQSEQSDESVAEERMFANLSSSMGGLTLLLVAIGLYGILSYSVGRRTMEIGIRMALGAEHSSVVAMILRESFVLVAVGTVIGVPVALVSSRAASRVLSDLLFGVKPADPFNLGFAIAIMVGVSLMAGFVPARRAAHVDPMTALRSE